MMIEKQKVMVTEEQRGVEEHRMVEDQQCTWILFGRFLILSILN